MTNLFTPITLSGKYVVLEPLTVEHHDDLVAATKDGELWKLWYTTIPSPDEMESEIERRLRLQEVGSMLPFTTRLIEPTTGGAGRVIGMTTFMNIDVSVPRAEIGSTWNSASSHGTGTNAHSRFLMLRHAFETLGCAAIDFRTHWMNYQSREAIARLGAKQDGILRSYSRASNGTLRDGVVFSILEHEWPMVR